MMSDAVNVTALRVTAIRGRLEKEAAAFDGSADEGWFLKVADDTTSATLRLVARDGVLLASAEAASVARERWWDAATFGLGGDATVVVSLRLPAFERAMACHLTSEWWTEPLYAERPDDVPAATQFLLWRRTDGRYGVLLPLVGGRLTSFIEGEAGGVRVVASTGEERRLAAHGPLFVAAIGDDPFEVVERVYAAAIAALPGQVRPRKDKPYPVAFERLGWCTWDAFYREVDAAGVRRQLEAFAARSVPLGFMLIDDGWYAMRDNQLVDTRPDLTKFPGGLRATVREAKERFGVRHVGAWHALAGYWCGIHPENTLPADVAAAVEDTKGGLIGPPLDEAGAFRFFEAWHRGLAEEGIDFVKVDGQGVLHRYARNRRPLADAARGVETGLQASTGLHFKGGLLNCMSMRHELVWNLAGSNLTRSSNDYMIHGVASDPGRHAQVNAANAVYLSQLSWCDFDMWRTDHVHAPFHAALRALSGGPVYISDPPGVTRPEVLAPLVLRDGRLLRCDEVGLPAVDCLLVDCVAQRLPLKLTNRAGAAALIGVFHVSATDEPVSGTLRPGDARGLRGERFAVFRHGERRGRVLGRDEALPVSLARTEAAVFAVVPIERGFAPIGLASKLVAPKTLSSWRTRDGQVRVLLVEGGRFLAYSERVPRAATVDDVAVPFVYEDGWLEVDVPEGGSGGPEVVVTY